MNVRTIIVDYLESVIHMSLATCTNNRPWVCEVHFAFDNNLNLYWRSKTATRHSQEIVNNSYVAGNIVEPHGIQTKPRGVYFEGNAELLSNVDELHPAYLAINKRYNNGDKILADAAQPEGHQFYKVTVADWYLFDTRESSPSQKYHLEQ